MALAAKYKPVKDTFVKGVDKMSRGTTKLLMQLPFKTSTKKLIVKAYHSVKALPRYAKVIGLIGTIGVIAGQHLLADHMYKSGKIDQKYQNKAGIQKQYDQISSKNAKQIRE